MLSKGSDYDYIGVFIGFLERILKAMQRLFYGKDIETGLDMKGSTTTTTAASSSKDDVKPIETN